MCGRTVRALRWFGLSGSESGAVAWYWRWSGKIVCGLVDVSCDVVGLLVFEESFPELSGLVWTVDVVPVNSSATCFGQGRVSTWSGALEGVVDVCLLALALVF